MRVYVIEKAYNDNTKVSLYNDDKLIAVDILSYYEIDGYIKRIEAEGYVKGYLTSQYNKIKEKYEYYKEYLEKMKKNGIFIKD